MPTPTTQPVLGWTEAVSTSRGSRVVNALVTGVRTASALMATALTV